MTQNQTMVYKPGLAGFLPARKKTGYSRKERGRPATEGFYPGFLFTVEPSLCVSPDIRTLVLLLNKFVTWVIVNNNATFKHHLYGD